ncbi:MAG: gamma carbonic anhydrase family protein [Chromatiales bacterium]|nr:gamma carbonic anhydrase family protein [Gammaproteobacteria bacterium]MBW6477132.1 gamma carbonic anhydrase family protein [Chromatiales bacterium]
MLSPYRDTQPQLGTGCYVAASAELIGDVVAGADSSFWPQVVVRGDVNKIRIGARSNVQDGSVLHVTHDHAEQPGGHPLLIGEEATIGHKVILHGCTLGKRVLIGMGAIVLDGVVIEDETMIGAGSLVPPNKHLEGGYLWLGQPVRRVRPLSQAEREKLAYSAAHYVRLKDEYRQQQ